MFNVVPSDATEKSRVREAIALERSPVPHWGIFRIGAQRRVVVSLLAMVLMLLTEGMTDAYARSELPDPKNAGVAEKLYRLDCGHSLANDESVWTPGENVG